MPQAAAVAGFEARWRSAARARRLRSLGALGALLALLAWSAWIGEVDLARLALGLPKAADYILRTLPSLRPATLWSDLGDWMWGLDVWLGLLADTVLIAFAGTVLGASAALLLSFPAASTFAPRWAVMPSRRLLELARTVPVLVFALIFVYAFGLGPSAGMLAIMVHTAGALGKQFAETHENADPALVEGIRAAGGSWPLQMRYGVLPQSLPGLLSYGLLRFEINVREASVLGLVGAGGIGQELYLAVRQFEYPDISAIVVLILATVMLIDQLCAWLRHRVIGGGAAADRIARTHWLFLGAGLLLALGLWRVDASPLRIWEGLDKLGWLVGLMWPPSPGGALPDLLSAMAETLAMAFLGTFLAALVALPLALFGAGNVVGSVLLRFTARRFYDALRGVDVLIWALIFVSAVGMGPFAGLLALAIPDTGTLAKTFSEALEAADRRPVEGIRAAGGGHLAAVRFGLLPQAAPVMLSFALYTFESNVRSATILGVVGAGGIGLALADRIRINDWNQAAFIVLMILAAVAAIDWGSRRLRLRLIRP